MLTVRVGPVYAYLIATNWTTIRIQVRLSVKPAFLDSKMKEDVSEGQTMRTTMILSARTQIIT